MIVDERDNWVILRIRYSPTAMWVCYEDGRGRSEFPSSVGPNFDWASRATNLLVPWIPEGSKIPVNFDSLIDSMVSSLPLWQTGPHASGPVPLAIFVEPPINLSGAFDWERFAESLLPANINLDRIQTLRLAREKPSLKRSPLTLPLRVLSIGSNCAMALQGLTSSDWYESNPSVQELGLLTEQADLKDAKASLSQKQPDIVIVDEASVDRLLKLIGQSSVSNKRPRLLIFLGESKHEAYVNSLQVPAGVAFLWLPLINGFDCSEPGTREWIKRFFYGLIHDYPLHEALKSATRLAGSILARSGFLVASPNSNQSLRLTDAMTQLQVEAKALRPWSRLGNIGEFVSRSQELSDYVKDEMASLDRSRTTIRDAVSFINNAKIYFDQESKGLVPLVDSIQTLTAARDAHRLIENTAATLLANPEAVEQIREHQQRSVDVMLQQLDSELHEPVNPKTSLRPAARYRVRLHVGHRSADSLMLGDAPPLDPLLPDNDEGHNLEVAFFEKDFELLSAEVQALYLPTLGGSEPVYFDIRAPGRSGVAEARIGIYYRNNLLQSFLLKANVSSSDELLSPLRLKLYLLDTSEQFGEAHWVEVATDKQVAVSLAFCQTARFTNLDMVAPRAASIGVNQNLDETSHTFMLKVDGKAQALNIKEKVMEEQVEAFRKILKANILDAQKKPLFKTYPNPGDETSDNFTSVVRQLIDTGAKLHDALYPRVSKEMRAKLRDLAATSDKTIQFIRHDPTSVFPWSILYDYELPTKIKGAPDPPICLGENSTAGTNPKKLCTHGRTNGGYCIYGFWGLRHQVEHLVEIPGDPRDSIVDIKPSVKPFIRLTSGLNDQYIKDLGNKMSEEMGSAFSENPINDLVELLWDDNVRPGILIVAGHLQISPVEGEPDEPRIVLEPAKKWFLASEVLKRLKQAEEWAQPNPVVLLMACASGATQISTLNDFVMSLKSAGAAAVIGTEALAFSSLVSRFAREITSDLWNKKTLGEAVKLFNRRLLSSGNPLPFIFNCLGNADIHLVRM
jgi:hypothetical protein